MTDEDAFQQALDAAPGDVAARLLFGEWLADRGDWRSPGYRWMGEQAKWPDPPGSLHDIVWTEWHWWSWAYPESKHAELTGGLPALMQSHWAYASRRDAEEALCQAILGRRPGRLR